MATVLEKMESASEPQHVAATCPECKTDGGSPFDLSGHGKVKDPRLMLCGSCGHDWSTSDPEEIAAAWFGIASYEKSERSWPTEKQLVDQARINRQRELYEQNMAEKKRCKD